MKINTTLQMSINRIESDETRRVAVHTKNYKRENNEK